MKHLWALLVPAAIITLASCNGFKETESGLKYKFHVENADSAKPAEGDMMLLKMKVSTQEGDSVLFDSEDALKNEGIPYFEPLVKPTFKGDYSEVLAMMHVGDSVTVKVNADTFFKYVFKIDTLPDFVESGTDIVIGLKMIKFMPMEAFKKYINAEMEKKEKPHIDKEKADIAAFFAAKGLNPTPTESGLYFIEETKGKGDKVKAGQMASVNYKGMFLDGTEFDSSTGKEPLEVPVGMGMVIPGWDEALQLMQAGTKALVVVPYRLGYGRRGSQPVIPPYSTLVFSMEVVKVSEMKNPQGGMPQGN